MRRTHKYKYGQFSDEEEDLVRFLFYKGKKPKDIATKLNRHQNSIYSKMNKMGLLVRDIRVKDPLLKPNGSKEYTEQENLKIITLTEEGFSASEVASQIQGSNPIGIGRQIKKIESGVLDIEQNRETISISDLRDPKSVTEDQMVDALDTAWGQRVTVKSGVYSLDGMPIRKVILARMTNQQLIDKCLKPVVFPPDWRK